MRRRVLPIMIAVGLISSVLMGTGLAAEGGGGGGSGGGGGGSSDIVYADLVVALRDVNGLPILAEYDVLDEESSEYLTERCVQPVSLSEIPGVTSEINPVDGRLVWRVPLQGELMTADEPVEAAPDDEAEDELGACDVQAGFTDYVAEAELERLNLVRSTDKFMQMKLDEVEAWLTSATEITLDGAGRIETDGVTHDAPPEYAAIYESLHTTGTLPPFPGPLEIGPFDWRELSATALATAAGKEVPITVDTIVYYNRIADVVDRADAVTGWSLPSFESEPYASGGTTITEKVVDYSDFSYDRAAVFPGCTTWLDVSTLSWQVSRIGDVADFSTFPPVADAEGVVDNLAGLAQLADDAREVIVWMHELDVIPGFFIDPVTEDTCDAQQAALSSLPAVQWTDVPAWFVQTETDQLMASMSNPVSGAQIDHASLQLKVDATTPFMSPTQVSVVDVATGQPVTLDLVGGNLVGTWGPVAGFPMPPDHEASATFDVTFATDSPLGDVRLTLTLMDLDSSVSLATDVDVTGVLDDDEPVDPPDDPTDPSDGSFIDVDRSNIFFADIEWMLQAGITKGCNPPVNDRFCPDSLTTRAQMASFFVRALGLTEGGDVDRFVDDDDSVHETDINRLAAAGITVGCNPPDNDRFCPDAQVSREQMASFFVRALGLNEGGDVDRFVDDDGSVHETDINRFAAAGITVGCNPPDNDRFCPGDSTPREQMAAFFHRALG